MSRLSLSLKLLHAWHQNAKHIFPGSLPTTIIYITDVCFDPNMTHCLLRKHKTYKGLSFMGALHVMELKNKHWPLPLLLKFSKMALTYPGHNQNISIFWAGYLPFIVLISTSPPPPHPVEKILFVPLSFTFVKHIFWIYIINVKLNNTMKKREKKSSNKGEVSDQGMAKHIGLHIRKKWCKLTVTWPSTIG